MNAVLTPEMRSLAAQFAGQQDFELDARGPRVFRVIGKTEDGGAGRQRGHLQKLTPGSFAGG